MNNHNLLDRVCIGSLNPVKNDKIRTGRVKTTELDIKILNGEVRTVYKTQYFPERGLIVYQLFPECPYPCGEEYTDKWISCVIQNQERFMGAYVLGFGHGSIITDNAFNVYIGIVIPIKDIAKDETGSVLCLREPNLCKKAIRFHKE